MTSAALAAPPEKVPVLRAALNGDEGQVRVCRGKPCRQGADARATALPHDLVIAFAPDALEDLALTAMSLADRPRPALVLVQSALERHLYGFVWLPRDEVSTSRRASIQNMLAEAANAAVLNWSMSMDEGEVAMIRISLDVREGLKPDAAPLDRRVEGDGARLGVGLWRPRWRDVAAVSRHPRWRRAMPHSAAELSRETTSTPRSAAGEDSGKSHHLERCEMIAPSVCSG
ncbi:MAG: NAD-glutamate dehydrogenase [Sphingobium sp.]|nr:NAD-glutamate dehydrogenase [Sphingobium sp.]